MNRLLIRLSAITLVMGMLITLMPNALFLNALANGQDKVFYIDISIDFSSMDEIKIGQRAASAEIGEVSMTATTDLVNGAFTDPKPNAKVLDIAVKLAPDSAQVRGNSEHGPEFISVKNIFMAEVMFTADGNLDQLQNNSHRIKFRVNGVEATGCSISPESVALRQEGGNAATGAIGHTVTDFKVSVNCGFELSGRTYYKIKKANDKKIDPSSDIGWNMPKLAEPGLTITFYDCLNGAGISDKVEYHTINGERIEHEATFVMPNKDVEVGIVLKGQGSGSNTEPMLVTNLNITLDFKKTDIDIYNGKKVPTAEDIKKAVTASADINGCHPKVSFATVDEIYDESFYAAEDIKKAEKWAGNLMLTFKVNVGSGFVLTSSEEQDQIAWQEQNVKVDLNGTRLHFMQGGLKYANGYFVTEYYMDGADTVEIHVLWYGIKNADCDITKYKAGDTVSIPDSAFDYDGYFVYKYVLSYTEPSGGITHFDNIDGKSFVMPKSDSDGVKLLVKYLRGDGKSALQQITTDASGKLELDADNSDFPENTVVNVDLISKTEDAERCELAMEALGDNANELVLFDIIAYAYNVKVQPDGRVIVKFPLPPSFDKDHLMFCYISQDGSYQELAIEVVNGIGVAELEHLSMYAIVSTKAKTDNSQHVIHIVSPVPQKPATCESFGYKAHFECGCGKIFNDINASKELAQDDIILPAGHIDADSDGTCDICDKGELKQEDIRPSQSATKEPSDTSQATEQATQPSTQGTKQPDALPTRTQTAPSDSSPWLIPVAVAAVIVIAVVIAVTVIRKRK